MTTFRSCHLIVNRKLADDRRHVCDFKDADFFRWGCISTLFLECTPSTNIKICSRYYAHLGETSYISTADDFIFTILFCNI